jgi:hypothetical protein
MILQQQLDIPQRVRRLIDDLTGDCVFVHRYVAYVYDIGSDFIGCDSFLSEDDGLR